MTVAALYVQSGGAYFGRPDVDPWDARRDARGYQGPFPVVAHPPCSRWCQLAAVVEKRYGHRIGDDGGCFAAALASVRTWGGVLEHPAFSKAWDRFGLRKPPSGPGWHPQGDGGWVAYVQQLYYGFPAKKATWLLAYGIAERDLPVLRGEWNVGKIEPSAIVSYCNRHTFRPETYRLPKKAASQTPPAFRELLLDMARGALPNPFRAFPR